jgi:hypothetical protein
MVTLLLLVGVKVAFEPVSNPPTVNAPLLVVVIPVDPRVIAEALVVPILMVPPVPPFAAPASKTSDPLVPLPLVLLPPKRVKFPLVPEVLIPG